jgi:hypothetical protein
MEDSAKKSYTSEELLLELDKYIDISAERLRLRLREAWANQSKVQASFSSTGYSDNEVRV